MEGRVRVQCRRGGDAGSWPEGPFHDGYRTRLRDRGAAVDDGLNAVIGGRPFYRNDSAADGLLFPKRSNNYV